jgi:hypothetical protein
MSRLSEKETAAYLRAINRDRGCGGYERGMSDVDRQQARRLRDEKRREAAPERPRLACSACANSELHERKLMRQLMPVPPLAHTGAYTSGWDESGRSGPSIVTIDQFLTEEAGGWGAFQNWLTVVVGLNYAFIGTDNIVSVYLAEALNQSAWGPLTLMQQQAFKSCFYLGGLMGFLISGPVADRYGRRRAAITFNALKVLAAL